MSLVASISSKFNYGVTKTTKTIHKIAENPSASKKVLQVVSKVFAAYDLYFHGKPQDRKIIDAMKGSIEIIEFYGTFKDIMFWINPFSKGTLDEKVMEESLKSILCTPILDPTVRASQEQRAARIFQEVMKEAAFYSKSEVREVLIVKLKAEQYDDLSAQLISKGVVIKQKGRPIALLFSMACFTVVDVAGNILTLQKWGLVDLAKLAAFCGQSRVCLFVMNLGVETVFGTIVSAALIVSLGESSYRAIKHVIIIFQTKGDDDKNTAIKAEAWQKLRVAIIDIVANSADLVYTLAPLIFVISPPVMVGLAIVAKGTGLICILIK